MADEKILTRTQSLLVGSVVGVAQTVSSLPFWSIKTRMQCGYKFTLEPQVLYKGFAAASSAITLMSASQVFFSAYTHRLLYENSESENPASDQRMFSALVGGGVSTILANPVGLVITQRHKNPQYSFTQTMFHLAQQHGVGRLYISFGGNCIVNSVFTFGFYGVYPIFKDICTQSIQSELISSSIAGAGIGFLTGIVSQPFDTVKTMQEKNADVMKRSMQKCFREIYAKRGILGFYSGFLPAVASTTVAITVAGIAVEKSEKLFAKKN